MRGNSVLIIAINSKKEAWSYSFLNKPKYSAKTINDRLIITLKSLRYCIFTPMCCF